jgi:hypothetical protein
MPGGGPIGSGYAASTPTPVNGTRSVDTAIQENVLGSPLDTAKRKRKRKMANFAGYRSAMQYTKTPETTGSVQPASLNHLSELS